MHKEKIVINRFDEKVDRNRRGIIVLLSNIEGFDVAVKNYNCFESENEDGGVYFPPQLSIEIEKGNHNRFLLKKSAINSTIKHFLAGFLRKP